MPTNNVITASRKNKLLTCARQHFYRYEVGLVHEAEAEALRFGKVWAQAQEQRWLRLRFNPQLCQYIRLLVKEWADHLLFLGYDVATDKEGKGRDSGTRTIWPCELPHCMAKSRTVQQPIQLADGVAAWAQIRK